MLIPIRTDNRLKITPTINYLIIAANIVIFAMQYIAPAPYMAMRNAYQLTPSMPHLYQFFTYMFLHADLAHIGGNMLFLWVFGNAINDKFGHVSYLAFYLGAGVLSGIGHVVLGGNAPVIGASGAIAGVTGCFLVLFPRVNITVLLVLGWIIPLEISSLFFLGFQFMFNIWASMAQSGSSVAYVAHCSGYIYGIVLVASLLKIGVLPRDIYDLPSLWKAHRRRQQYRKMVSEGYDPFTGSTSRKVGHEAGPVARDKTSEPRPEKSPQEREINEKITAAHRAGNLETATKLYMELLAIAENSVLPMQQQLDISNKLMSDQKYPQAADGYERLLKFYPGYANSGDIRLMLGIIYSRYLTHSDKARKNLNEAIELLSDNANIEMARAELKTLDKK